MDPERCEYCGGADLSVEFMDDYRAHLHPECFEGWNAERLSGIEDSREGAL